MSGHRNVNDLLHPIMENPERRARVAEEKRIMDAILILHERRERMGATQEDGNKRRGVATPNRSTYGRPCMRIITATSSTCTTVPSGAKRG